MDRFCVYSSLLPIYTVTGEESVYPVYKPLDLDLSLGPEMELRRVSKLSREYDSHRNRISLDIMFATVWPAACM